MRNDLPLLARRTALFILVLSVLLFLAGPVLVVPPMSFSSNRYLELPPESWSLRWYERLFSSPDWTGGLYTSLRVAVAASAVATPLGVAAAYALHAGAHTRLRHLNVVLLLPLLVPHIVLAIALFYFYVKLDILGSFGGIVAAHVLVALPFVIVAMLGGFKTYDMTQEKVALSLGASRTYAFLTVTLPQIKGSVLSAFLFAFVTSMDEVVISLFISSGLNQTITKVMFGSVQTELDPTVAAVSSLLITGSILVVSGGLLVKRLWAPSGERHA